MCIRAKTRFLTWKDSDAMNTDIKSIQEQVLNAVKNKQALAISGTNSKSFYGNKIDGESLSLRDYQCVIQYEPTELYITAKAGTSLRAIEQILTESGQLLAFEPPQFNDGTIGGAVASGLSGPARPYLGAVRDFVLGVKCINGKGELLSFGGQVMKNVAGYDVSRLLTGSLGTLGVILEVTLKVLPVPRFEASYLKQMSFDDAKTILNELASQPVPFSATAYDGENLYLRLSGHQPSIEKLINELKFDALANAESFWASIRNHSHAFFKTSKNLWRLSLPIIHKPDFADEPFFMDWGGAQYWLATDHPAEYVFDLARKYQGSATLFYDRTNCTDKFQPLSREMLALQRRIKMAFDPNNILNPGRMYSEI